jgi:hypothetical protein
MGFIELAIFFEFSLQKVRSIKLIRAVTFTMPTVYTLGNKLHLISPFIFKITLIRHPFNKQSYL